VDGQSDAPPPTAAERKPIVVHQTVRGWQVDYGSYVQGYHASLDEAIEAATQAAQREGRTLTVDPDRSGVAAELDRLADEGDRVADERDRIADELDRIADELELIDDSHRKVADHSERLADDRKQDATQHRDRARRLTSPG
jgi:hypothetical protein